MSLKGNQVVRPCADEGRDGGVHAARHTMLQVSPRLVFLLGLFMDEVLNNVQRRCTCDWLQGRREVDWGYVRLATEQSLRYGSHPAGIALHLS